MRQVGQARLISTFRRVRNDLIEAFKTLNGIYKVERIFVGESRMRGNCFKIRGGLISQR